MKKLKVTYMGEEGREYFIIEGTNDREVIANLQDHVTLMGKKYRIVVLKVMEK